MADLDEKIPRWSNRRQFLLSSIGYTVGLGNFWRFPWLVQAYGGGVFLIAYAIMFLLVGIPVLYLEFAVGRLMRTSTIASWSKISPYTSGIGITSTIISFIVGVYYIVIIAWCFLYFVSSFQYPLPWSQCPREIVGNISLPVKECAASDSVSYHFYRNTLDVSSSINEGWTLHSDLLIGFVIMWVLLILSLYKGIKSAGKVVYFTAIFPYVALVVLLIRGNLLDGAVSVGLKHFFSLDWSVLKDIDVWYHAAAQNLYSMGLSFGVWTAYSSFCPPSQHILIDIMFAAIADIGSSILGGVVIFQILGSRAVIEANECLQKANITNTTILSNCNATYFMEQTQSGHGLAFIAFSQSITHLPGSPLFSVLFFLLLVALGTDSMFGMLEACVNLVRMTSKRFKNQQLIPLAITCIPSFLIGLTMVTGAGSYVMELIIIYGGDLPVVIVGLLEILSVTVFYGVRRFSSELKERCQQKVPLFICFCWYIMSPVLITGILCLRMYNYSKETPELDVWNKDRGLIEKTGYPNWAYGVAITLCIFTLLPIPLGVIYGVYRKFNKVEYIATTEDKGYRNPTTFVTSL